MENRIDIVIFPDGESEVFARSGEIANLPVGNYEAAIAAQVAAAGALERPMKFTGRFPEGDVTTILWGPYDEGCPIGID